MGRKKKANPPPTRGQKKTEKAVRQRGSIIPDRNGSESKGRRNVPLQKKKRDRLLWGGYWKVKWTAERKKSLRGKGDSQWSEKSWILPGKEKKCEKDCRRVPIWRDRRREAGPDYLLGELKLMHKRYGPDCGRAKNGIIENAELEKKEGVKNGTSCTQNRSFETREGTSPFGEGGGGTISTKNG